MRRADIANKKSFKGKEDRERENLQYNAFYRFKIISKQKTSFMYGAGFD